MNRDTTIQLRHLFEIVSGSTPESGNADYWDGDIAWVTPEDVSQVDGNLLRDTRRKLTAEGFANSGTTMVRAGGIVLTKRAPIGQLALLGLDACSNQGCFLLSARQGIEPRFFYYVLANSVTRLQALGRGSTFMELSTDDLKALRVPVLAYDQQVRIANYLDASVAKIDELMQSKRDLLEILAEKRKAIIATAVTRGLDPKMKLRDSGVPWLGEIPAHWETCHLRRVLASMDYGTSQSVEPEGQVIVLRMGDLRDGELDFSRIGYVDAVNDDLLLRPDDLLFNRTNSLDQIGKVAKFRGYDGEVSFASYLVRLRANQRADSEFLNYLLNSAYVLSRARAEALPAIGQANLNPNRYSYIVIAIPPTDEQRAIVEHISRETAKLDAVRAATERTIALLKERRAALIAVAVTGQVDVTGYRMLNGGSCGTR